ncbi:MAG: septation protein A [Zoogloeaceae bacterium]|jgi:intracellular septation protein|nr:septation protein A [Zoogloeaceae bacterium]
MKFLFDLFPAILFFISYLYSQHNPEQAADWVSRLLGDVSPAQAPILLATIVIMLAAVLQSAYVRLRHGKIGKNLLLFLVLVIAFGSLTLILRNENFIKWKPTALYWVMAGSMAVATLFKHNAMRLMLADKIALPEAVWLRLNFAWIGFFVAMGALNLFVAYRYSTEIWMYFKMFGVMGLLLLFAIAQGMYLSRFITDEVKDERT